MFKSYSVFGKHSVYVNNTVDIETMGSPAAALREDMKKRVTVEIDDTTRLLAAAVNEVLDAKGYMNYGVDFVRRKNTNEFYFFDLNSDTIQWAKLFNEQSAEVFAEGVLEIIAEQKNN